MSSASRNGSAGDKGGGGNGTAATLRIDKWLWHARFFKSRSLANAMVAAGRLRVNSQPISKPHHQVRPGDVLTFPQARRIRVVEVAVIGTRRGPAAEAQTLYADLAPLEPRRKDDAAPEKARPAERERGAGRPTKKERRETDRLRG
ncbi:MAG: RNA-binding S4 domain-containing protein [Alphaproteobacteria bacterium]|nr:RNA-binding S4 domain-containing protein [Alphaproteobacteria bacterium]